MKKASQNFQIFLKPVGSKCNLACHYCYYLEKGVPFSDEKYLRMPDDLLEKYIIQHIEASPGADIFFSWHGGEPTLAGLQYFQCIVELQKKHQSNNCRIINGMQTNGTLLNDEWCRFLKKENFVVGISLDGPEEFHSEYRQSKNGNSSFKETLRGLNLLKSHKIPFEILCVVNSRNVRFPLAVYSFFKELQAGFITFLPLVGKHHTDENMVSERTVPAGEFGEFLCAVFDEWKENDIGKVKIQIFEEAIRTAFQLEHSLCILRKTCGGVPVVEHNGDFYSCDHFVDPMHLIGNINEISLVELLESQEQQAFGQAKLDSLPKYCLNCEVLEMCNGACPKDRFINTPDRETRLNYLYEGYKLFFNHCKPFVEEVAESWKK